MIKGPMLKLTGPELCNNGEQIGNGNVVLLNAIVILFLNYTYSKEKKKWKSRNNGWHFQ